MNPLGGTVLRRLEHARELLQRDPAEAELIVRELLKDDPLDAAAYRVLADAKARLRQTTGMGLLNATGPTRQMRLAQAHHALREDDLPTAEIILRARLLDDPTDVAALQMLAELASRLGLAEQGQRLLVYALELDPDFWPASIDVARHHHLSNRHDQALLVLDSVLAKDPDNDAALYLKAAVLGQGGRWGEAVAVYRLLLDRSPDQARLWANYGRALKTIGRADEGVEALRRATELDPLLGEAWWSLSDFKTVRLGEQDIKRMRSAVGADELTDRDRSYFHFALGKAFEDQRNYAESFRHYAEGNRLKRVEAGQDVGRFEAHVHAVERLFTRDFFRERQGWGDPSPDPIFILGMTRSGSTLLEQILASHSQIEGTMELQHVPGIAHGIAEEFDDRVAAIAALSPEQCAELGRRYLQETRSYRHSDRPFFIDKMPNNWLYVPLIQLMLPNARIIDARREPLACCFSNFKQNYARGQSFSYDLEDIGRYYVAYVRQMAHLDAVLPGRVHRVFHEALVENTEAEIRRMLDYLQLPFEPACLRFHETARSVGTPSAEQVRRPINRSGMEQWKSFEPWLDPLKFALGPVLDRYPDVPDFA